MRETAKEASGGEGGVEVIVSEGGLGLDHGPGTKVNPNKGQQTNMPAIASKVSILLHMKIKPEKY